MNRGVERPVHWAQGPGRPRSQVIGEVMADQTRRTLLPEDAQRITIPNRSHEPQEEPAEDQE